MSYSFVFNGGAASSGLSATTPTVNSTGVDLIVYGGTAFNSVPSGTGLVDSKGNTLTPLTGQASSGGSARLYYCFNPTVGSGHSVTSNIQFGSVFWLGFSGAVSSPFDQENGATGSSVTSLQPGTVTPSEPDELVVTMFGAFQGDGPYSISGETGYTITDSTVSSFAVNVGGGMGYKILSGSAAQNMQWDVTDTVNMAAVIATFKTTVVAGSTKWLWAR